MGKTKKLIFTMGAFAILNFVSLGEELIHKLNKTDIVSEYTGKGIYTDENGTTYMGDFVKGKSEGYGKVVFKNGDVYEGQYLEGEMQGKGKYTFKNGDIYEGDYQNNKSDDKYRQKSQAYL